MIIGEDDSTRIWIQRSVKEGEDNLVLVLYVGLHVLHFTLDQCMSKIFLCQKPPHEFLKHATFGFLFLQILRQCFWTRKVFLYFLNVSTKPFNLHSMLGADLLKLGVIEAFLYHFYCFLADIEANVFIVHAFASKLFFACFLLLFLNDFFPFVLFVYLEK